MFKAKRIIIFLNKLWWITLLRGIILVILAFFVFRHPVNALIGALAITTWMGIGFAIAGIVNIDVILAQFWAVRS